MQIGWKLAENRNDTQTHQHQEDGEDKTEKRVGKGTKVKHIQLHAFTD